MVKFRLVVHKLKCIECDLLFMVEKQKEFEDDLYCPSCDSSVEHMGDIVIVEEK